MIVIVDYGIGNLMSLLHRLKKIGINAIISSKPKDIEKAEKLILPGVGHFATGIKKLEKYGLIPALNKKVLEGKTPILGICLGMQLFTERSEEGYTDGLGWINGETKRFDSERRNIKLRIPHMGWNNVNIKKKSPLFENIQNNSRFYFAHSYHVCCENKKDIVAITNYGYDFVSAIQKENIFGTQFHPEKSHKSGVRLIKNFAEVV